MGAVLSATKARRGIMALRSYLRLNRYSELGEITRDMLGTYGSIGSDQRRLDVAQRRVDPLEGGRFGGSWACAGLNRGVGASDAGDGRETRKTVGQDLGVGGERRSGELADRDKAERFDRAQDDLIRFSVFRRADRRHERRLALGASSAWARTSAADVCVVHLDGAFQSLARVALEHDLRELVLHYPGCRLGDAEPATQFDAGDAFLGLREEKDSLEPDAQRQLAAGEYGSSLDGGLLAAGVALEQAARASIHEAMAVPAAVRTFKPIGPTQLNEGCVALLLAPVHFVETGIAEPFLKLDHVARHCRSPAKTKCSCYVLSQKPS